MSTPPKRPWHLAAGPRLVLCTLVGLAIVFIAPALGLPFRIALGWVVGVGLYLLLTVLVIGGLGAEQVRRRAREQDAYGWVIFFILVGAAVISLLALGAVMRGGGKSGELATALRLALAGCALAASWVLVHATFAFRYAHRYYGDHGDGRDHGGLGFPGDPAPDYWDFIYFSFVVGMTCQVSDVQVSSRPMRRLTLAHGVLSFAFNTVILALAVNFLAGML